MEAAALLLLFVVPASALSFYGDSVSFMPPHIQRDGRFKVAFHRRLNGRSNCAAQSSFTCEGGVCTNFDELSFLQTDRDNTGQGRWCQSEGQTTATISTNQTTFSLRVPQNCFSRIRLLTHDPDGDNVRCRFTTNSAVSSNFTLDQNACTLTSTGQISVGVHVFELMLEDFPTKNITLTYADGRSTFREASNTNSPSALCRVKLQFSVEILPSIPNCEVGRVLPMFLSMTPSHGAVLYATVGQKFQLFAEAQARHASIRDFQVSGPTNMTKVLTDEENGKAKVTLSWTPTQSDLYRFVPVCFTAETNETQSEMRCVVVMVTQTSIVQGKATVVCSPNMMVVALEKTSMPDIDKNFLQLRDRSCSLTSNSTHIMGSMSFSTCGTRLEVQRNFYTFIQIAAVKADKGDLIAFTNEINSFELPTEIITRRKTVKIGFSCQFPKTISIHSYYNLHKTEYIFTESSFGSFGYSFEIFTNSNFTNKVEASAYPVQVKLLDTVYMGIQARSELPNVTLFVESCKATPDDNPENNLSYDLIKNGCLKDETIRVYTSDQRSFNFEVQAFKFTGNYEQVYITCSVILCEPGSPFSRCARGCLNDPSRRRRRGLSRETVGHYITQGPLQFVGPAVSDEAMDAMRKSSSVAATAPPDTKSSEGGWRIRELLNTNTSTVVFATFFLASLLVMAALVGYFTRKRRADDRKSLLASGWEN
ncbi:hypothetical protein L3Q82_000053 [Scortum barcoo]|uniref:Uncharacterized protein n=1 Tax=Scortum barcoo TaxID=214431 RepID=A0ACB8XAB7_9TELE|nr:hypothetical protein L3Q82_000053 [Scortum barcoo]